MTDDLKRIEIFPKKRTRGYKMDIMCSNTECDIVITDSFEAHYLKNLYYCSKKCLSIGKRGNRRDEFKLFIMRQYDWGVSDATVDEIDVILHSYMTKTFGPKI